MSRKLLLGIVLFALVVAPGCDRLKVRLAMVQGTKLYKAQKYDEAIAEFKKIVAMDPQNFNANYLIAISNLAMYHPGSTHPKDLAYAQASTDAFEKTLKLTPPGNKDEQKAWHEKLEKYYLSLLTAANKDDKAVEYLEAQRAKSPNDVTVIQQLATYYAKSDFNKALGAFTKVAELAPTKEHWYTVGVVCWERSYKGGMAVSDEERQTLIDTGQAALTKALSMDPDYFEALSYVNLLHREQAKVCANRQDRECYDKELAAADATVKKALEARKKKLAAGSATQK